MEQILVADLPDEHRHSWHLAIAEALEETNASPILLSYHYEQAGLIDEAARLLEAAGDEAVAAYAFNTAIAYYNRAAQLVEFRSVYKNLGKLYQQIGKGQASVDNYQQALILAQQTGDIADQANILNSISLTHWLLQDQYQEAYQRAASVLSLSGAPETEQAIAQSNLGMVSWYMGRLKESEVWCQKAVAILKKSGDEECLATTLNRLGLAYLSRGKLSEAEISFQSSLALREKLTDRWGQAFCLNNLGKVATEHGHFKQATSFLESAQSIFEKIESQDGQMVTYTNRGRVMLYQNDFEKALHWLSKAFHLAQQVGKQTAYGLSDIYLLIAQARVQNGELDQARAAANDALKIVKAVSNPEYMAITHSVLAQIYHAQDDRFDAETAFQKSLALFREIGSLTGLLRTQRRYALFLRNTGETVAAQKLEAQTRVEAKRIGLYLPND
jgi:tetratricopeptide (TPR) repeat protein